MKQEIIDNREQKLAEEIAKEQPDYHNYLESLSNEELMLELDDRKYDKFPPGSYVLLSTPDTIFLIWAKRGLMKGLTPLS